MEIKSVEFRVVGRIGVLINKLPKEICMFDKGFLDFNYQTVRRPYRDRKPRSQQISSHDASRTRIDHK